MTSIRNLSFENGFVVGHEGEGGSAVAHLGAPADGTPAAPLSLTTNGPARLSAGVFKQNANISDSSLFGGRRRSLIPSLPLVILAVLAMAGCSRKEGPDLAPAADDSASVGPTLTVSETATPKYVEATGTVEASLAADLAPKIMSKVAAVLVKEGERVGRGQVVVRLESADLAAQVKQAQAAVLSAKAALAQAQTGAGIQRTQSSTRVTQAEAALRQAQEQLSLVKEGARKQHRLQADEGVRQAEAGKAQAAQGVRQAEAALASAKAQLDLVKEGARRQQKLQAEAAVRQAEANLKTAQATYDRFKPLADEGVISKQRFDEIALQLEVAKSQHQAATQQASLVNEGARSQEIRQAEEGVRQAEAGLQMAKQKEQQAAAAVASAQAQRDLTYEGARTQEVQQAEQQVRQAEAALELAKAATGENEIKTENVKMLRAQVAQAEAALSAARVRLSYAAVSAPFAGVVTRRHVDPGAMAVPGTPLISLVDDSGFRFEAQVPESQMSGLRLGGEAEVSLDALGVTAPGKIAQIVPAADRASRTFVVKVHFTTDAKLSPGLFGRVRLPVGETHSLRIPESAVWRSGSLVGVSVVAQGQVHSRLITVGKTEAGQVEVLSGLQAGETILEHARPMASPEGAAAHGGDSQ